METAIANALLPLKSIDVKDDAATMHFTFIHAFYILFTFRMHFLKLFGCYTSFLIPLTFGIVIAFLHFNTVTKSIVKHYNTVIKHRFITFWWNRNDAMKLFSFKVKTQKPKSQRL